MPDEIQLLSLDTIALMMAVGAVGIVIMVLALNKFLLKRGYDASKHGDDAWHIWDDPGDHHDDHGCDTGDD